MTNKIATEQKTEKINSTGPSRNSLILSATLNIIIVIASMIGNVMAYNRNGLQITEAYTIDSNIFAVIACGIYGAMLIRQIATGKEIPKVARMMKYMAVCYLSLTFIVVVLVLAPMFGLEGYKTMLFSGDMLYHHLISPVLAFLTFILYDFVPDKATKASGIAMIMTIIYAIVVTILNIAKVLVGPYPFFHVYEQPIYMSCLWFVIILGGAWAIAFFLAKLKGKRN